MEHELLVTIMRLLMEIEIYWLMYLVRGVDVSDLICRLVVEDVMMVSEC